MLAIELQNAEPDVDSPARFAADADIELADRLRRQLEERYLARSAPLQTRSSEGD
jgi:hypothetical protein